MELTQEERELLGTVKPFVPRPQDGDRIRFQAMTAGEIAGKKVVSRLGTPQFEVVARIMRDGTRKQAEKFYLSEAQLAALLKGFAFREDPGRGDGFGPICSYSKSGGWSFKWEGQKEEAL